MCKGERHPVDCYAVVRRKMLKQLACSAEGVKALCAVFGA